MYEKGPSWSARNWVVDFACDSDRHWSGAGIQFSRESLRTDIGPGQEIRCSAEVVRSGFGVEVLGQELLPSISAD